VDLAKTVKHLLRDSDVFLDFARDAKKAGNSELEERYSRATVIASWCALEGWVNYVCSDFSRLADDKVNMLEKSFLREKKIDMSKDGVFEITTRNDFQSTTVKLSFLLRRFGDYSVRAQQPKVWNDFKQMENARNLLVHPSFEKEELHIDARVAEKALRVTKQMTALLKEKIYGR
jgi:hypothetical protein